MKGCSLWSCFLRSGRFLHIISLFILGLVGSIIQHDTASAQPNNPCWKPMNLRAYVQDQSKPKGRRGVEGVMFNLIIDDLQGNTLQTIRLRSLAAKDGQLVDTKFTKGTFQLHANRIVSLVPDNFRGIYPRSKTIATGRCPNGQNITVFFDTSSGGDAGIQPPSLISPSGTEYNTRPTFEFFPSQSRTGGNIGNYELVAYQFNNSNQKSEHYRTEIKNYRFNNSSDPTERVKFKALKNFPASQNGMKYSWTARAIIGGSYSQFSTERSFIVKKSPGNLPAPSMISPVNDQEISRTSISHQWTSVDGADGYRLQVKQGNTIFKSRYVNDTRVTIPDFKIGKFCARVRAEIPKLALYSAWSQCIPYEVIALSAPNLLGPGDKGEDTTPTIKWSQPTKERLSYEVVVTNLSTRKTHFSQSGIRSTSVNLSKPLSESVNYQIMVRAHNGEYFSAWSRAGNHKVEILTPRTPVVLSTIGAFHNGMRVPVTYTAPPLAQKYNLQVRERPFTSDDIVMTSNGITGTSTYIQPEKVDTDYCIMVQAVRQSTDGDVTKTSGFSSCPKAVFHIVGSVGVARIISPADGATTTDPTPTITWTKHKDHHLGVRYDLYVTDETGLALKYSRMKIYDNSHEIERELEHGEYKVFVRVFGPNNQPPMDSLVSTFYINGVIAGETGGGSDGPKNPGGDPPFPPTYPNKCPATHKKNDRGGCVTHPKQCPGPMSFHPVTKDCKYVPPRPNTECPGGMTWSKDHSGCVNEPGYPPCPSGQDWSPNASKGYNCAWNQEHMSHCSKKDTFFAPTWNGCAYNKNPRSGRETSQVVYNRLYALSTNPDLTALTQTRAGGSFKENRTIVKDAFKQLLNEAKNFKGLRSNNGNRALGKAIRETRKGMKGALKQLRSGNFNKYLNSIGRRAARNIKRSSE